MVKFRKRRQLHLEHLERRALLAGLVQLSVSDDGDLRVFGDDQANGFSLQALSRPGSFEVVPDSSTSINKLAPGTSLQISGVLGDLRLDLSGGDDRVSFSGLPNTQLRRLVAQTGTGDDELRVDQLRLSNGLDIRNEQGVDLISLSRLESVGAVRIEMASQGGGTGQVLIDDVGIHQHANKASPDLMLYVSNASDTQMQQVRVDGEVRVDGDGRVDLAMHKVEVDGAVVVRSRGWGSQIMIDQAEVGSLDVEANDGPLLVDVIESRVGDALRIVGTGDSDDVVRLSGSQVTGRAVVRLNGGSDRMRVHDSVFGDGVLFDGGAGDTFVDVLTLCNNRFAVDPIFRNWEDTVDDDCDGTDDGSV